MVFLGVEGTVMGFFLFVTFKDVGDFFGKKPDKLPTPVFKAVAD